jgi:hypothetical protein
MTNFIASIAAAFTSAALTRSCFEIDQKHTRQCPRRWCPA